MDVSGQGLLVEVSRHRLLVDDSSQGSSGDKDRRVLLVDGDRQGFMVDDGRWDEGVVGARAGVFDGRGHRHGLQVHVGRSAGAS